VARVARLRRCTAGYALAAGAAAGLALLTKGTGYIIAAPLLAAMGLGLLKAQGHRALSAGLLASVTIATINLPHWARNERAFGDPIATPVSRGGYPVLNTA